MSRKKGFAGFVGRTIYLWPAVILMLVFFVLPIALTIYYSFTNLALTGSAAKDLQFVGLSNYARMLTDSAVAKSIFATVVFLVISVVGQTICGFFIAFLMREKNIIFRRVIGAIVLAAWVMPEMVAALCAYTFFTDKGSLNLIIKSLGGSMVSWLFQYPLVAVSIANIWHGTAFSMMVYQSALDNISEDVLEAAKIDGANGVNTLVRIIIPMVKDTVLTNTMLITLSTLGTFGMVYALTGTTVQTLPIFMYLRAFKNYELGYGTAISMLILLIGAVFSLFYIRFEGKKEDM